jgi:membrane associated rhomboid family serine protease
MMRQPSASPKLKAPDIVRNPRHSFEEAQMIPIRNAVPTRYPPVITWMLIATNCLVFLFQDSLSPDELLLFLRQFALIPARYLEAFASGDTDLAAVDIVPFFTMMFLHGGWLHLILNMWTLWLFGPAIEDRLGHGRYLAFYLVCGLAASVAHVMFNPTSIVPALGASGAIAGILGCYMRLFPLARVVVVVPILLFIPLFFEVYAYVFIGLWFLLQILQSMAALVQPSSGGDVAWWAHVGGFVAGFILGPLLVRSEQRYRLYYPDEGTLGFNTRGQI